MTYFSYLLKRASVFRRTKGIGFSAAILTAFILFWPVGLAFSQSTPLLMEGKKSLHQRVIAHPGATWSQTAGQQSGGASIVPFTVLYVYERQNIAGELWLRCATNTTGKDLGWISADYASDWKQSLVLKLAGLTGRDRLMFFKSKDDIVNIADQAGIANQLSALREQFAGFKQSGAQPPASFPVVGMEAPPQDGAVSYDHFYLMPIFNYNADDFESVKLLEVGSIDPGNAGGSGAGAAPAGTDNGNAKNAIVFVIDTTKSMGPYIEQCRNIARNIYDRVIEKGLGDNVALGVVAFRSSVKARPDIQYTTKIVSPLRTATDREAFDLALSQEKEATASTHSFSEDSLAGLNTAIEKMDWAPYQGRVILLITDAGPLPIDDPFNSVPGHPTYMADKAKRKNIKIVTIHLKSSEGKNNHLMAEEAYRALSFQGDGLSAYLDVNVGSSSNLTEQSAFTARTESLVSSMEKLIFDDEAPEPELEKSQDPAADIGAILGYSIKLDYLGAVNQTKPPSVVRAWIPDKDLANLDGSNPREVPTTEVAVLLSKNQLSNLMDFLQTVVTKARDSVDTQSGDIFEDILKASSRFAVDPNLQIYEETRLADIGGMMSEMLADLPYKSTIMSLTKQDWFNMGPIDQDVFIRKVESIITAYREYDKDLDNWGKFDPSNEG
ncbi:MAG: VWA domain-containing protein, partial [Deltaproteobacteria bacterium]|nr:VWA domain-containing protein [Deltaproteobacteria bacterium]